ncbi:MAG: adenine-specific DNA-methyltransferase [Patescibacteria group bacterium]|nr:adenine-specific DNA-methyltransferase [Patescibacteria group bacterium]
MSKKQKLELTWIGKGEEPTLEPRILIEDPSKDYGDSETQNILIHGDNLLALKALEQDYAGKVKCIYIDPPYNTGSAFEHYDDGLEHSEWLRLMQPRLILLNKLLSADGILAVQIDDNEFARLYLLLAEIFGDRNLKVICVKMSEATGVKMASVKRQGTIPKLKEYIILAGKNGVRNLNIEKIPKDKWDFEYKTVCSNISKDELDFIKNVLENEDRTSDELSKVDNLAQKIMFENINTVSKREIGTNATEPWLYENAYRIVQFATLTGGARDIAVNKKSGVPEGNAAFSITTPQNRAYLIRTDFNHETRLPRCKFLFADIYLEVHPGDFWQDIKTTGLDNEGSVNFSNGKKPEKLVKRIIGMSTDKGDLVLDSFLGSGTTAAVAHKMGRKWIGIELGEHAYTHSVPRLQKVIDGSDNGGISKEVAWKGGGGFKFYELAPSLLSQDSFGNWVIAKEFDANMLAHAMAKQEGFTYSPSQTTYWKQGSSTENDYIFTTTQHITVELLDAIHNAMQDGESLLIACKAFDSACKDRYDNITIKKIPHILLGRCEFGKDDYSLNITENTEIDTEEGEDE